jgi:hypothetical protein
VLANAGTASTRLPAPMYPLPPLFLSSRLSACPCLNYVLLNNYGRRGPCRRRSGVLLRMFCCRQAASKPPLSSSLASHLMSTPLAFLTKRQKKSSIQVLLKKTEQFKAKHFITRLARFLFVAEPFPAKISVCSQAIPSQDFSPSLSHSKPSH